MGSMGDFLERERRELEAERKRLQRSAKGLTQQLIADGRQAVDAIRSAAERKTTNAGVTPRKAPGDRAARAGSAVGWGGVAHDGVTTLAKMAVRNPRAVDVVARAFGPAGMGLKAASTGLTAFGSSKNDEPLDVTAVRVALPLIGGAAGAALAAPSLVGSFGAGVAGGLVGEYLADQYAKATAAHTHRVRSR